MIPKYYVILLEEILRPGHFRVNIGRHPDSDWLGLYGEVLSREEAIKYYPGLKLLPKSCYLAREGHVTNARDRDGALLPK